MIFSKEKKKIDQDIEVKNDLDIMLYIKKIIKKHILFNFNGNMFGKQSIILE